MTAVEMSTSEASKATFPSKTALCRSKVSSASGRLPTILRTPSGPILSGSGRPSISTSRSVFGLNPGGRAVGSSRCPCRAMV